MAWESKVKNQQPENQKPKTVQTPMGPVRIPAFNVKTAKKTIAGIAEWARQSAANMVAQHEETVALKCFEAGYEARMHEHPSRDQRQKAVADWCLRAFGEEQATNLTQRGIRLLEEAIEAYQATGATADMAHKLVDFIFNRPVGELNQELGGVAVTLLALANAASISADEAEVTEIQRVLSKPIEQFAKRNSEKNEAGFHHGG